MSVVSVVCVCCQIELITGPEESYRLWCVVVCDLETSRMRRPWPNGGCCAKNKQSPLSVHSTQSSHCHSSTYRSANRNIFIRISVQLSKTGLRFSTVKFQQHTKDFDRKATIRVRPLLGAFGKRLQRAVTEFVISVRPSTWNTVTSTERILVKFRVHFY